MKIKAPLFHALAFTAVTATPLAAAAVQNHSAIRIELTQAQAIDRVKTILRDNADGCRITSTQRVSAIKVKAGWRVTARIRMSANGTSTAETATWIVSARNSASAQDQLTAEITNGCR